MRQTPQKFTITIPVKPYVKRFLEFNYSLPIDFVKDPLVNKFFRSLLRKPNTQYENKYPDVICTYTETVEIVISEHDFYRYGWELTKTDIVSFGRYFEDRTKALMRSVVGINIGLGIPVNKSITDFQDRFDFNEDTWRYEAIKKDFYRHGKVQKIDFHNEIFLKIEKIILLNLYDLGTISQHAINDYETT